jgi:hypothetical protein
MSAVESWPGGSCRDARGGSWSQPGDPLRGRPIEDLLEVTNRVVADAPILERQGPGLRIEVDRLAVEKAADAVLTRAAWPTARGRHR